MYVYIRVLYKKEILLIIKFFSSLEKTKCEMLLEKIEIIFPGILTIINKGLTVEYEDYIKAYNKLNYKKDKEIFDSKYKFFSIVPVHKKNHELPIKEKIINSLNFDLYQNIEEEYLT